MFSDKIEIFRHEPKFLKSVEHFHLSALVLFLLPDLVDEHQDGQAEPNCSSHKDSAQRLQRDTLHVHVDSYIN